MASTKKNAAMTAAIVSPSGNIDENNIAMTSGEAIELQQTIAPTAWYLRP